MALSIPNLKIVDPATGQFLDLDGGARTTQILLSQILIELRVHSVYLQAMNMGIVGDDLPGLRADVVNDPANFNTFTVATSTS